MSDPTIPAVADILAFPVQRGVQHCGLRFDVPSLAIYADCPKCLTRLKVRCFGGGAEIEDIFDALAKWSMKPGAIDVLIRRAAAIRADDTA